MKAALQLFNFTFQNKTDGEIDVHIDGYIVDSPTQELMREFWGDETSVSFKSFRNQIEAASPKILNVYINSGGGHVGDAMAMHDYMTELERKGVKVNRIGRGIIASAATYLNIGNNSEMTANSFMMIHNVQMICWGDIVQCENQVKAGRKFNDRIRDFYAEETSQPPETIASWMNKETWMTAQEAKERGFIKAISGEAEFTNSISADQWPFSNTAILNRYNSFTKNSDAMKIDMSKIKDAVKNVLAELGLGKKEDGTTDDAKLNDAVDKISNSLTDNFKPLEDLETNITNACTTAITNLKLDETIKNQVTEAIKGLATKEELTKLSNEVSLKLGKPAKEKEEEEPGERKVNNRRNFFRVGNFASETEES